MHRARATADEVESPRSLSARILENADMRAEVAPSLGGKFISLYSKRTSTEWLLPPLRPHAEARSSGGFEQWDGGGFDECLPTVAATATAPDHGEVWRHAWQEEATADSLLLRTAARQQVRWATPEDLLKFPAAFYAKAGIAEGDVIQTDGSGLSRHDLVTPRAFVALLNYAQKQPWFPAFLVSLPVAGADGTLNERMKEPPLAGKIHAKTGSVTHVRSLSGYAETPGGSKLIFSFLSNNQGGKNHEVHAAIDGVCLAMVEEFDEKREATKQGSNDVMK